MCSVNYIYFFKKKKKKKKSVKQKEGKEVKKGLKQTFI